MPEEEIRVAALTIAVELSKPHGVGLDAAVEIADRLAGWIKTGELPPPAPGTY